MTADSDRLCERFGLECPIFQGGMGYVSTAKLAGAVSAAGGLGVIATGGTMEPEILSQQIAEVREQAGERPFGVNVLLPNSAEKDEGFANRQLVRSEIDVCLRERVPVVVSGLGDPRQIIDEVHAAGAKFVGVVGSLRAARKVQAAGADAVVAQGSEAGGHVGQTATLPLAQAVLRELDVPVLMAGGIATGAAVAAALALGASGVSVGTRFLASDESDAHPAYKQAVVDATENHTIVTRACTGKPSRALRNEFTLAWEGRDADVAPGMQQAAENLWRARAGAVDGDIVQGFLPMGQGAAVIDEVLPAAEIVARLATPSRV
jgi:enoyl-[acyl-carrier protein] reductase II